MFGQKMHLEETDDYEPVQFTSKEKTKNVEKAHIDMTPMVDVVFQLLTFFLLAVKRDSAEPLDVPVITRSTAVLESQATFITVKPAPRGSVDPIVVIGENRRGKGEQITPEMVKDHVIKGVQAGRPYIVIKAERLCKHGDVLKISRIVASVEGAHLHVGVQNKE